MLDPAIPEGRIAEVTMIKGSFGQAWFIGVTKEGIEKTITTFLGTNKLDWSLSN